MKKTYHNWLKIIDNLNSKLSGLGFIVHFVVLFFIFFIMFTALTQLVIEVNTVRGVSMEPTLSNDDKIVVFKSEMIVKNIFGQYIPKRGEMIIFEAKNTKTLIVKRVVGLPNETIIIEDQMLIVINNEYPSGFIPDIQLDNDFNTFKEEEQISVKLKEDEIYVLGDNRDFSADSRVIGPIPLNQIKGKLIIRAWPFSQFTFF